MASYDKLSTHYATFSVNELVSYWFKQLNAGNLYLYYHEQNKGKRNNYLVLLMLMKQTSSH